MALPISELKDRLKKALSIKNMKPIELVEKTGIPKSAISQYMSGYAKPKQDRIYLISKALEINEGWLMGYDVPMEREQQKSNTEQNTKEEIENPDIRMIARAGKKMTPEQAELLRKYAEFTFPEAFKKDGD